MLINNIGKSVSSKVFRQCFLNIEKNNYEIVLKRISETIFVHNRFREPIRPLIKNPFMTFYHQLLNDI